MRRLYLVPTVTCLAVGLVLSGGVAASGYPTQPDGPDRAAGTGVEPSGPAHRQPWSMHRLADPSALLGPTKTAGSKPLVSAVPPPGDAPAGWHPCASATQRCDGEMQVPLNWDDAGSERITVAFAWLPRRDRSRPATGTILANPGGPGEALSLMPLFELALGPVLERQNLLMVDPRGLGRSSPLLCPELNLNRLDTIDQCAAYLGDRIQFFAADQSVADLNAVRHALGAPTVAFYGNSYGTAYAQAFVTRYPRHVSAVFLDSVVYTRPDGYVTGLGFESPIRYGLRTLDMVCDPSRPCRALPRDADDRWGELVRRLLADPDPQVSWLRVLQLNVFTGEAVLGREANAAAASYLRGDPAPLRRLTGSLDAAYPPGDPEMKTPEAAGMLAYGCADSSYPFDRDASQAERRRQLDEFYATDPFRPYSPEVLTGPAGGGWNEWCVRWPTPRPSPVVPPDGVYPRVPVLVVNGQLDTTTTPIAAAAVAARFPRATFIEVRFGDHASAFGLWGPYSECVRDTMRSFLARPTYNVANPGCSAENYRAVGTFPRSVRELAPATGAGLHGSERRLVAAAFSTGADALARRNPYATLMIALREEPGLRGGHLRFDDANGAIELTGVRYVDDLAVSGVIQRDETGRATATLHVTTADGASHDLRLTWQPFQAEDTTAVRGTLDGRQFLVRIRST